MGRVLNFKLCVKPLKWFKPCHVTSGTLLYRNLLYSRTWSFSCSAGGPSKTVWDSEAVEATCKLHSYARPLCSHRKKKLNITTSIFSSILYRLVSALINITACSSYPCKNSYFQNWNSMCAEIANWFFAVVTKPKFHLCSQQPQASGGRGVKALFSVAAWHMKFTIVFKCENCGFITFMKNYMFCNLVVWDFTWQFSGSAMSTLKLIE